MKSTPPINDFKLGVCWGISVHKALASFLSKK